MTKQKTKKAPAAHERRIKYIFPNANQCPRCKAHDTVATSTQGDKQYRLCRRGHCRYRYCVTGILEKAPATSERGTKKENNNGGQEAKDQRADNQSEAEKSRDKTKATSNRADAKIEI